MLGFILIIAALVSILVKIILHIDYIKMARRIYRLNKLSDLESSDLFLIMSPMFFPNKSQEKKMEGLREKKLPIFIVLTVFYISLILFFVFTAKTPLVRIKLKIYYC